MCDCMVCLCMLCRRVAIGGKALRDLRNDMLSSLEADLMT